MRIWSISASICPRSAGVSWLMCCMIWWPKLALAGRCGQRSQGCLMAIMGVVPDGLLGFMISCP